MNTLLLMALAGIVVLLFLRRRKTNSNKGSKRTSGKGKKASTPTQSKPFRATTIVPGAMACDAAVALAEKPFLDSNRATPPLPLPNCTAPHCRCKYVHRDDRREEDIDRRFESGMQTSIYRTSGKEERRTSAKARGRRKSDFSGS
jgi:hypothetical protein